MDSVKKESFVYLPPKMYAFLVRFGEEYNLSVREVLNTILRHGMEELGFSCEHMDIRTAKSTGKPYCYNCWTRMRLIKAGTFGANRKVIAAPKYEALATFLDGLLPTLPLHEQQHHTITKEEKNSPLYDI